MIKHAANLYKTLETIPDGETPIIVPVFNLVSYAKFMVEQLQNYNLQNFIICDNNSDYQPMIDYLNKISKEVRVVRFSENLGPRVFAERPEFLSIMPKHFIITDPDLIFNPDLPKNFIDKMKRIIDMYGVSKVGFAIDIEETKEKFFDYWQVKKWESHYWANQITINPEKDSLFSAAIDTTFCLYDKEKVISELKSNPRGITSTSGIRIAGRFTCQHMGWWKEQPLTKEEESHYNNSQMWASTYNEKKKLGFV